MNTQVIGIHSYDLNNIPAKLKKSRDVEWHIFHPDELRTHGMVEAHSVRLKSSNITYYGNQEWHTYWAVQTVNNIRYSIEVNPTPACHFTVLNRKPRNHRIDIMNKLDECKLLENNYYSWLDTQVGDLPYASKNHINFKHCVLDGTISDENDMWSVPSAAFGNSAASVVLESSEHNLFITEKSFIPLYQKRLPLIYGSADLYKTLQTLGFEFPAEIDVMSLCSTKDVPLYLRRQYFVEQINNIVNAYSPEELVELYKPYAEKNKQTLINITKKKPKCYSSWKRIVPNWAKSAKHFIKHVEKPPVTGYKY